jgi:hypothetical protein
LSRNRPLAWFGLKWFGLKWLDGGYFFNAAFQFTTTFNGGEEAAPEPAGVAIKNRLPSAVMS